MVVNINVLERPQVTADAQEAVLKKNKSVLMNVLVEKATRSVLMENQRISQYQVKRILKIVDSICEQVTNNKISIIDASKTRDLELCTGRSSGSCVKDEGCKISGAFCIDPCIQGEGVRICETVGAIPKFQNIGINEVCQQETETSISVQKNMECCVPNIKCKMPGSFCKKECIKGEGFYTCNEYSEYIESDIPGKT